VLLGDPNQLPPVNNGHPFKELLRAKIPQTILTETFRFDKDSIGILKSLEMILRGQCSDLKQAGPGFEIINTNHISKRLIQQAEKLAPFDINKARIMGPLRSQVKTHTPSLREVFNGEFEEPYVVNDWIIQRKNNVEKKIFNGSIGQIKEIREVEVTKEVVIAGVMQNLEVTETHFFIKFDEHEDLIELADTSSFTLAYITTVHSSQGAESDNVILLMDIDSQINTRELLFTAVSRAKKSCKILGSEKNVYAAVGKRERPRYSCLAKLIDEQ
jgi:ATP-dependent exoDNAse (exonuclease V) alpha subunit